ncbi:MAG: UDP-N-acetylmuramoyl-tripeptide--D-alanyl-D-alanine ligase [Yoonia sp.]|nr:UDP-N-acetylmuramoyl-tripeptide--D-alanyl-D-alanine ligase [Yoonia sp.]
MSALWTMTEAAKATGGVSAVDWAASGVSIDTRTIQAADLFVALKDIRDGHDFVALALQKGAAAALVTHRPEGVAEDAPLLIVPNVLEALEKLGVASRERTKAKVVGVTGSVGKTSTKEMLRAVLSPQGKTHVAEASYNNHWGVPLTLARMPADADFAVIEIGMNHPGEIAPLSKMAAPHVVMITTVAAAHLEAFENIAGIAVEKAAIMDGLVAGGVAVLNADIPTVDVLTNRAAALGVPAILFGLHGKDWTAKDVRLTDQVTVVTATHDGTDYLFKLAVPGRHFAMNGVGVMAVVDALGADTVQAALDIGDWVPPGGRGTREVVVLDPAVADDTIDLIDDAFNANPTSMTASLEILAAAKPRDGVGRIVKGRRIAILGDMLELGPQEFEMHRAIAQDKHLQKLDIVHCVGPRMQHLHEALSEAQRGIWALDAAAMCEQIRKLVDAGDVVLVKGSKGSKVSTVVDAIRKLGHRRA